jgi:hypothetical protein
MNLAGWPVPWLLTSPSGPLQSIELFHPLSSFELLQVSKQNDVWQCSRTLQVFMHIQSKLNTTSTHWTCRIHRSAGSGDVENTLYAEMLDAFSMALAQLVALDMGLYLGPVH